MEVDEPESRSLEPWLVALTQLLRECMHLLPMDIAFTLEREMSQKKLKISGL